MTLLKDLIDIPERIQKGDFVLRLAEGVNRPEQTLGDYVVTDALRRCFDDALSFIRSALEGRTSKAAYLHGSFGSGKSHFMAVLHLLLQGSAAARSIPELAAVISKHNAWLQGRRFLLVPYHMIGARNMEAGILGGYADFIRRVHPEARIPAVYLAEGLFRDAGNIRATMGDAAFFATLNKERGGGGGGGGGGWGDLEADWDAAGLDSAAAAPPGSEERSRLVSALVTQFFSSYDTQAAGRGEAFLELDKGLSVLSRHAQSLGYDALILFLDELILWLASHAADLRFVHQEGQKLAKLVEAQTADRPVPIISFVARQRDLSELIGDAVAGAERLNFSDALKHWEGRFHKITLEDRNLPAIAEKRVLKCKSAAARAELDAAFEQTARMRESVMNTLLTSEGDRAMFSKVYPFSPALVQALIAVSSALQRERTALKVMMQLLVEQRDTLRVGDIVPVGDLFDVIAHGDEAFSQDMAIHFENAKRLYHEKLLPALEREHGRREDLEGLPHEHPKYAAFRNDDRLVKTLLLSALVPGVEALRGLSADRLAALNHGTIKSPIPGREGQMVLQRCKDWARHVGEIRIGEGANPSIAVQLTGVDTESIIEQARREDNQGNRIRRVRQILYEQLGIDSDGEVEQRHEFMWRNTSRSCTVLFKNIRELPDTSLASADPDWTLIIDFPFDESGRGPRDDVSRIHDFHQAHPEGARTLLWLPEFFSEEAQKDLGLLVILEHVLAGERFGGYAAHLSPQDRQAAKTLLENQRSVLRQRVMNHLEAAYGLGPAAQGSLAASNELEIADHFRSLLPGFDPQPPVAANLAQAMAHLLGQALEHEFPAHPKFEAEIKRSHIKKVYDLVSAATRTQDGRIEVDKPLRPLIRQIADPLWLGDMGAEATHFVLGRYWKHHFTCKAAESGRAITVAELRRWIDSPKPMGLPRDVQNLVILIFAEQTNRTFYRHGAAVEATLTDMSDVLELREQRLPDESQWGRAVQRAGSIFGVAASPLINVANVSALSRAVKQVVEAGHRACLDYARRLRERLQRFGLSAEDAPRMQTAAATLALLERIHSLEVDGVVAALAAAGVATSEPGMGECFRKAADLAARLDGMDWEILEAVSGTDEQGEVAEITANIKEALTRDEHVLQLGPALKGAQAKAVRLLAEARTLAARPAGASPQSPAVAAPSPATPAPVSLPSPPPVLEPRPGRVTIDTGQEQAIGLERLRALLDELRRKAAPNRSIMLNVSWRIDEERRSE